jgi:hypothetical protein
MSADIDIDLADRDHLLRLISCTPAAQLHNGELRKHNSGVYATCIPTDPRLGIAAIDHETAEHLGYFKIDLLNMHVYRLIRDHAHYESMMTQEPPWHKLWQDATWSGQLVHVGNYVDLLAAMRPDSIPRMAAFISVIRPGKAHLQNQSWDRVFAEVWDGDSSRGYIFKRSHAVSYAVLVALHMNLLASQSCAPE